MEPMKPIVYIKTKESQLEEQLQKQEKIHERKIQKKDKVIVKLNEKTHQLTQENLDLKTQVDALTKKLQELGEKQTTSVIDFKKQKEIISEILGQQMADQDLDNECLICAEELNIDRFVNDNVKFKMQCNHTQFHTKCLQKWLDKSAKPKCPLCNQRVDWKNKKE